MGSNGIEGRGVAIGDATGLIIPPDAEALLSAGDAFLTRAFQVFGVLGLDNRARIKALTPCPGGSTGQKVFLTVEYEHPALGLDGQLFVKFSRDFSDPVRDRGRFELEAEVKFAALSRTTDFPVDVPRAYFADYEHASGTGVLITQAIPFGRDGIEPHRGKCLDALIPDPEPYYQAILTALARLAAAHKSGRLGQEVESSFPFDPAAAVAGDAIRHDAAKLHALVARYAQFAGDHPGLLPPELRTESFIARMDRDVGHILEHEGAIKRFLYTDRRYVALCHWNAHIDNAWFWRDPDGVLRCGLLDWGRVRQLNLACALWGALSGADSRVWAKLDELVELFCNELRVHGGPALDPAVLKMHMDLYVATMGLAWMMEAPARVLAKLPNAAEITSLTDPRLLANESARNQLHIFTAVLSLWERRDFGASLDRMLALWNPAEA